MTVPLALSEIRFVPASEDLQRTGLLGWVTTTVNGRLRLDGIAVRRTADGRITLAYPERRDGGGRRHALIRPVSDEVRQELEAAILRELGMQEAAP